MKRFAPAGLLLLLPWLLSAGTAPVRTHQVKLNGHTFTLPVGFGIEPRMQHRRRVSHG